jgi:hypothetical protein
MKVNCQHASATLMPREITVGSHLRRGCLGPRGGEEICMLLPGIGTPLSLPQADTILNGLMIILKQSVEQVMWGCK